MEHKSYWERDNFWIDFEKVSERHEAGQLSFSTYSYEIDGWGDGSLNYEDTQKLFAAMYIFYAKHDKSFLDKLEHITHRINNNCLDTTKKDKS